MITTIKAALRRVSLAAVILPLTGAIMIANIVLVTQRAHAAQLTSRSLSVSSSANGTITTGNPGSGSNGQKAAHTATFTLGTSGATVGSIAIFYCDSPIPQTSCTTPTGLTAANLTSATVSGQTGSFSLDTTTTDPTVTGYGTCNGGGTVRTNCVLVKAASGQVQTGTPTVTITYGGGASNYITNPSADNQTFYARIVVFSDTAYTTVVDAGSVASSTAQQIDITAKVQETLNFSVGSTVTAPGTSCTAFSDSGALTLGDVNGVLSFTQAYDAFSYFRVSTNAANGTKVYYSGDTLKSGTNSITAAGTTAVSSAVGSSQFGLGLDSTNASYSFTSLTKTAPYDSADGTITNAGTAKFAFDTASITAPKQVASSSGTITCDTGSVRYIGNVSTTTPPGIYTTTITYLAVPTY